MQLTFANEQRLPGLVSLLHFRTDVQRAAVWLARVAGGVQTSFEPLPLCRAGQRCIERHIASSRPTWAGATDKLRKGTKPTIGILRTLFCFLRVLLSPIRLLTRTAYAMCADGRSSGNVSSVQRQGYLQVRLLFCLAAESPQPLSVVRNSGYSAPLQKRPCFLHHRPPW